MKPKQLEVVTLTPELAGELLEHNQHNRPISDQHVARIANQIVTGKWRFNGDTIKISDDGSVLDGQHRLWACIESKKAIETVIIRGIAREAFSTVDTLRKVRSGGDVIALAGATRYRSAIANALAWMIRWQRDCIPTYRAPENKVENSDIEAAYAAHPNILHAVERATQLKGVVNPSVMGFFFYVLSNRDLELAERMIHTLRDPARIAVSDPYFRLRSYFTSNSEHRKDPITSIALMIKASNFAAKGVIVERLSWKSQGQMREAFPTLEVRAARRLKAVEA